jgi:hypothetical protein
MDLFWLMWIGVILGQPDFDPQDIPLFVVTSLSAGVLGACLNNIHDWLSQFRPSSRHKSLRFYWNSFSLWLPKAHFFHKHFPSTNKLRALELEQFAGQQTVITDSNLTFFCLYGVCVRVIEACLATLVSVAIIFLLPHFFGQCLPMQDEWVLLKLCDLLVPLRIWLRASSLVFSFFILKRKRGSIQFTNAKK